jgi:hypothetical protein
MDCIGGAARLSRFFGWGEVGVQPTERPRSGQGQPNADQKKISWTFDPPTMRARRLLVKSARRPEDFRLHDSAIGVDMLA